MRTERTAEILQNVASDLTEIAAKLNAVADDMIAAGMPTISVHSKTQIERHIPMLLQWVYKIEADAKVQLRSSSKQSRAGMDITNNGKEELPDRQKSMPSRALGTS